MNGRVILLVVLVATLALVGCTQNQPATTSSGPTIGVGESVSFGTVKLEDTSNTILFTVEGERVYLGSQQDGNVILTFDGTTIRRGATPSGQELFTVGDNGRVFVGASTSGPDAYTVDSNGKVHEGAPNGAIIYTVENNRMFEGSGGGGAIVFDANVNLESALIPLLAVLADRAY